MLVHRIKLITWAKFIWGLLLKSVDFLECNDSSCPRRQMHLRYCYYEWKQETIVDKKKKWRWEFPPDLTKNKDILWPQNKKKCYKVIFCNKYIVYYVIYAVVLLYHYLQCFFPLCLILYNYPAKGRWMVMVYRDAKRRGIYLALWTDPEGDSCFSIYQISG